MKRGKGRPSVPVGTICPCSVCEKPHEKQPKRMVCPACLKAEDDFWARVQRERREEAKRTQQESVTQEHMRGSLHAPISLEWLRRPLMVQS